jgi:hypothetical protein
MRKAVYNECPASASQSRALKKEFGAERSFELMKSDMETTSEQKRQG